MPAQWLSNSGDLPGRVTTALEGALHSLAQPERARRLRQVLLALFALWAVLAIARLVWALFPTGETAPVTDIAVINPVSSQTSGTGADAIDIDRMVAWHLFGEAGATPEPGVQEQEAVGQDQSRDGIEQGARETGLDLKLRGVVASSEDGMGHAIIESKKRQAVYAVDDKLPVSGQVVLAKVMSRQVVLDNGGKYELLTLYEETDLDTQVPAPRASAPRQGARPQTSRAPSANENIDRRVDGSATALARSYRERLYQDPQSLADVVSVSAVRRDGELLGYRIGPGKNRAQFEQLGFKSGDLVTGVNGITLNDPANTMRLYQTMRSASEAVFELQRDDQQLTVNVRLDSDATGQ